jgi:hypothetical protein
MHWKIKLEDENGCFWKEKDRDRSWSDTATDAWVFDTEHEANLEAEKARAEVSKYIDWFPKVKVVCFKGGMKA